MNANKKKLAEFLEDKSNDNIYPELSSTQWGDLDFFKLFIENYDKTKKNHLAAGPLSKILHANCLNQRTRNYAKALLRLNGDKTIMIKKHFLGAIDRWAIGRLPTPAENKLW